MSNQTKYARTVLVVLLLGSLAQSQTFTSLYSFAGPPDGAGPSAGVIEDSSGNLYGTAPSGGSSNSGAVFKLTPDGKETVLYNFSGHSDGSVPLVPLIRDSKGNLYGATAYGGIRPGPFGCGTVFMIDTTGALTVLHTFAAGLNDGCRPEGGLTLYQGSLYGTTYWAGTNDGGIVYRISKHHTFTVLHNFTGAPGDGAHPYFGSPVFDKRGNMYGVTYRGGSADYGIVYKLNNRGLTVLHSFTGGSDGCYPSGTPIMDTAGTLYGTTYECGSSSSYGTVWKVTQKGAEAILHRFGAGSSADGCYPYGGIVRDPKGNLYGNASECGAYLYGTVWALRGGRFTLLHSFDYSDGGYPAGDLLFDRSGILYGTTLDGGASYGTVWSIK